MNTIAWPQHDGADTPLEARFLREPEPSIGRIISAEANLRARGFAAMEPIERRHVYEIAMVGLVSGWLAAVLAMGSRSPLPWQTHLPTERLALAATARVECVGARDARRWAGAMTPSGFDVGLLSMDFAQPRRCAACNAPARAALSSHASAYLGRVRCTLPIQYCRACAKRIRHARVRRTTATWLGCITGAVSGWLVFAMRGGDALHAGYGSTIAAACALAVGVTCFIRAALRPPRPPAPAHAGADGEAVWIVSFGRFRSLVHGAHPGWSTALADANRVAAVPRRRRFQFARRALVLAALFAAASTSWAWLASATSQPRLFHGVLPR
jgi:hypothetical protein